MKKLLLLLTFIAQLSASFSQIPTYSFNASAGTYTPITGGTVLWSGTTAGSFDDNLSAAITIPAFLYNCVSYTSCKINTNGFVAFGAYTTSINYLPISGTVNAAGGLVVGFGKDLVNALAGSPEVRYQLVGSEFVVQYQDVRRSGTIGEQFSFQIRFNTTNNVIKYVYGPSTLGTNSTYPEIGLKGPNNVFATNVKNVTKACGTAGWLDVVAGTANNDKVCFSVGQTFPANGTTFTWSPPTVPTPAAITGVTAQCPGVTGQTYSVPTVAGATSYAWTLPTGWAITAGGTTNSITVTTGSAGQNGNISVTASSACGISAASTIAVTVGNDTPSTPGTITGSASQCPGITGQTYSIASVTNATTYTWTVPTGWTITSGAGTNTITVTSGSAGQNGNITVTAGNACGTSAAASAAVTVLPGTPSVPGTISGTATQCPAVTTQTYSVASVTNATTYTWTVPTGWTITSGSGTNTITVSTGATGQNGNITVTAGNTCGTSTVQTLAVTVGNGTPSTPASINGTATQCPGVAGQIYSVPSVPTATTYTWTVPTGWSITGGAGTNTITVTTGATGQNGNITVTAGTPCGTSAASTFAVTVTNGTPLVPGAITGLQAQCPGVTSQTYSIAAVTNATTYTWTVPTGWTITSGAGTTSITVTAGSAGQNGNITVTAGNSCGTSGAATKPVVVSPATPSAPATINGTATQCPSLTSQTYSVSSVTNATTYTWTVPTGWVITSGAGTNSITVTTGATGDNGNITVTAGNSCGTSAPASVAVTVGNGTPSTPGSITGTMALCPATSGQTYSIAAVTNATTYNWTVPTGWTITAGAGTNSITVTSGAAGQNGAISVTAGNACGTSSASTMSVTVEPGTPSTPGSISGTTTQCPALTGQTYSVAAVTDATTYTWTVPTGWTITSGAGTNTITVTTGTPGQNGDITVTAGNSCGTSSVATSAVTVAPGTPAAPASITGEAAQCPATAGQTYSVTAVTDATTYTWTVPTGWTITAGAGTNTITVTSGAAGQNGDITVTAGNICGTSSAATIAVIVNALPQVSAGADTVVCTYNFPIDITATGNATSYSWSNGSVNAVTNITAAGTYTVTGTLNGCTSSDAVIVTSDPCAGIDEATGNTISLYPNPTNDNLTIVSSATEGMAYSIYTIDGKFMASGEILNGTASIDVLGFAPGKYFVHTATKVLSFEVMH
jgi:hypothetical protein